MDVRDVADAVLRSLRLEGVAHDCFLLAARDTSVDVPTRTLLDPEYPHVPWAGGRPGAVLRA